MKFFYNILQWDSIWFWMFRNYGSFSSVIMVKIFFSPNKWVQHPGLQKLDYLLKRHNDRCFSILSTAQWYNHPILGFQAWLCRFRFHHCWCQNASQHHRHCRKDILFSVIPCWHHRMHPWSYRIKGAYAYRDQRCNTIQLSLNSSQIFISLLCRTFIIVNMFSNIFFLVMYKSYYSINVNFSAVRFVAAVKKLLFSSKNKIFLYTSHDNTLSPQNTENDLYL